MIRERVLVMNMNLILSRSPRLNFDNGIYISLALIVVSRLINVFNLTSPAGLHMRNVMISSRWQWSDLFRFYFIMMVHVYSGRTNVIQKTGLCINGSIHIFGALYLSSASASEPTGWPWSI
jgi:hypothetical protein